MANPLTYTRRHTLAYGLFWTVVGVVYAGVLVQYQPLPWGPALVEAWIHSLLLGLLGLVVWFVVRYAGLGAGSFWQALLNHTAAALLLLSLWALSAHALSAWWLGRPLAWSHLSPTQGVLRSTLGLAGYSLVALLYYVLVYYQNYRTQQVRQLEMQALLRETELSMLKAQLNPHFLFNSLNSLSSLTLTRPQDAHEMMVKLATFLRYTLSHPETELVTWAQELETTRLYLDIERLRFGDRLQVRWEGVEALPDSIRLPHLVLQPLVENALKHGVYERLEGSELHLKAEHTPGMLVLTLRNPLGDTTRPTQGSGIGLDNVRRRLTHHYYRADLLEARSHDGHFSVTLRIPQAL